jgi:hypothetical protein
MAPLSGTPVTASAMRPATVIAPWALARVGIVAAARSIAKAGRVLVMGRRCPGASVLLDRNRGPNRSTTALESADGIRHKWRYVVAQRMRDNLRCLLTRTIAGPVTRDFLRRC